MKRLITGALVAGFMLVPLLTAQEKQEPKKTAAPVKTRVGQTQPDPKDKAAEADPRKKAWTELQKDMTTRMNALRAQFEKAASESEKQAIILQARDINISVPKAIALAKEKPGDEVSRDILFALAARPGLGKMSPSEKKFALETLEKYHLDSPQAERLASMLCMQLNPDGEKLVNKIRTENKEARVRGMATFYLARAIKTQSEHAPEPALGEKQSARALGLFEELNSKEFDEVKLGTKSLKDYAADSIYELKFLAIGKIAPEIEAEDINGVSFKLSEYRGKIVVIDFWGDW